MITELKLRLPDQYHPHTIEINVLYSRDISNWKIHGQERKSGAGRGASPTWFGFKDGDYKLAYLLANAPGLFSAAKDAQALMANGFIPPEGVSEDYAAGWDAACREITKSAAHAQLKTAINAATWLTATTPAERKLRPEYTT
jgi:hypothetical protein